MKVLVNHFILPDILITDQVVIVTNNDKIRKNIKNQWNELD